jgi:hypothetical protein
MLCFFRYKISGGGRHGRWTANVYGVDVELLRGWSGPLAAVAARVEIIVHVLNVGDLAGERFRVKHFEFGINRTVHIHHAIDGLNVQLRRRTELRMLTEELAHLGIDLLIGSAILRRAPRKYGAAIETRAKNQQADYCNGFDFLHLKDPLLKT